MAHVATVTIDNTKVPSDQTDFVVYVDLSDLPTTEFWGTVANGGGDIRCYKSDGTTELAREVVSCDTATDTGELHVKFSGTLSSSVDTEIQIHADGASSEPAASSTYGSEAVWSDYQFVWHGEDLQEDSTGKTTYQSATNFTQTTGTIGDGADLNGSNSISYWTFTPNNNTAFTLQNIINTDATDRNSFFSSIADKDSTSQQMRLGTNVNGNGQLILSKFDGTVTTALAGGASDNPTAGTWWWQAGRASSQTAYDVYVANSQISGSEGSWSISGWDRVAIGASADSTPVAYADGQVDEVRLRWESLSDSWLDTEYNNQSSPSTFYSVAAVSSGTDISPYGLQALQRSYQPVAASRLNGVMQ